MFLKIVLLHCVLYVYFCALTGPVSCLYVEDSQFYWMVECRICSRRVLSHAYQMTCALCSGVIHLKCLPFIDRNDPIYAERNTNIWFCTVCTKHLFPFNHYDDDNDYDQAIFDISNMYSCKMSIQELRNRAFVPFDLNDDIRTPLVESDPDIQYF